jgi:hypothetical protein
MTMITHENIRIKVAQLLRGLLKELIRERPVLDFYSYTLLKILDSPEITILMPQEIRVGMEKKRVDMAFGTDVVFEFKISEREFDEAEKAAREKYWPIVSRAKFFITTNWDKWRIYSVTSTGLSLIEECDWREAEKFLKTQIIPRVKEIKIPPLPENVEALYKLEHEELLSNLKKAFGIVKEDPRVKPLYEAYKSMMSMLYSEANEGFFEDLFIRHTYMHIAVLASLTAALGKIGRVEDVCSGSLINIDVALPYLNWWKVALQNDEAKSLIEETLGKIVARTNLIDWSLGVAEEVFRNLYEFLVEPSVRRDLGEYYTPIWLVEMMINEFDVKGKVILDPFCGSGTFLVKAFYAKHEAGEDPDSALNEVVGFDINPLAIAVTRAELIIAYRRICGKEPESPPHIYHIDTLAIWFGGDVIPIAGLEELMKKARAYLWTLISFKQIEVGNTFEILSVLRNLERNLTYAIRFSYYECKLNGKCLEERIESYLKKSLRAFKDAFTQRFLEHFEKDRVARSIANLIVRHGGNDVWAVVLISIYAPILMTRFKPDIIITNPPWIPVTEYKAPYSNKIREYMLEKIRKHIGEKAAQVIAGADIAAAALGRSIELAHEGVGFIMNKDQLFNYKYSTPAGIVATYCILKDLLRSTKCKIKLLDFDFDVFQHGIYPAVIIIKKR